MTKPTAVQRTTHVLVWLRHVTDQAVDAVAELSAALRDVGPVLEDAKHEARPGRE